MSLAATYLQIRMLPEPGIHIASLPSFAADRQPARDLGSRIKNWPSVDAMEESKGTLAKQFAINSVTGGSSSDQRTQTISWHRGVDKQQKLLREKITNKMIDASNR